MPIQAAYILPHPPILLPEIGRGEEKKISKTAESFRAVSREIANLEPDTIVILSPHSILYSDYFHISPGIQASGDFSQFGSSLSLHVNYDTRLIQAISMEAARANLSAGTLGEKEPALDHGTMVPLAFIQEIYKGFQLVRISLSGLSPLDHYSFGKCIAKAIMQTKRKAVIIASGDLSHKLSEEGSYGFAKEGPEFDARITKTFSTGDFLDFFQLPESLVEAATECGLRSFQMMAGILDGYAVEAKLLSYEGPFGVGYGVASFFLKGEDDNRKFDVRYKALEQEKLLKIRAGEDVSIHLARLSLESYLKGITPIVLPNDLPQSLTETKAGVFVSLKKYGRLRGCIGTIEPVTDSIAEEILRNAISAGLEDPRFPPVTEAELEELVYSVDVLGKPEKVEHIDQLDVKRYGVIVRYKRKRGLLLPNLEGVDTVEQQLSIAMQKAGIYKNEAVELERFEVVRHEVVLSS